MSTITSIPLNPGSGSNCSSVSPSHSSICVRVVNRNRQIVTSRLDPDAAGTAIGKERVTRRRAPVEDRSKERAADRGDRHCWRLSADFFVRGELDQDRHVSVTHCTFSLIASDGTALSPT